MLKIYCTFDVVSEEYSQPWFAKNDNVARRNLLIASQRQNLPLQDIQLYCIGNFNTDAGFLFDSDNPSLVLSKVELVLPSGNTENSPKE